MSCKRVMSSVVVTLLMVVAPTMADVFISEYYEGPSYAKAIELYNDSDAEFNLGTAGYRLVLYSNANGNQGIPTASLAFDSTHIIPANGVFIIVNRSTDLPPGVPWPSATVIANSQVVNFNGDDAIGLFGPDISTVWDNCIDMFGLPGQQDAGPRGSDPYMDSAWERKPSVTTGIGSFTGFDPCNFDGLKECSLTQCPRGTPVIGGCTDGPNANQWNFEGLNPSGDSGHHTLGSHSMAANSPPTASSQMVITSTATLVTITLAVSDPDGPAPLEVKILSLPANGTLYDGATEITAVPYVISYEGNLVDYQSDPGFNGTDSFTFTGVDGTPQDGNTATVNVLVQGNSVVITEIMYNPANVDEYWEWIEIYNGGDSAVNLGGFDDAFPPGVANLSSVTIQPEQILIIARADADPSVRTEQQFLDEWRLQAAQVVFVAYADWPALNNSGGDNLYLTDSTGAILDAVLYKNGSPWPASDAKSSIYVTEGNTTTTLNDSELSWELSAAGTDGAQTSVSGADVGSPGYVPGISSGNQAPYATGETIWVGRNGSWEVDLEAADDGLPSGTLDLIIDTLPTKGSLIDVDNGETPIGTVPYTIPNGKKRIRYTNGGLCGDDAFTFHADDGEAVSTTATITVWVECGELIITEVMYNPASAETDPKVTEWIEVYNTTETAIDATGWYLTKGINGAANRSGDWPSTAIIPAHGVAVIVPPGSGARTMDDIKFKAAWDGYDVPIIIIPTATNDAASGQLVGGGLANTPASPGEMLRIIDLSGRVQDIVSYRSGSGWPSSTGESSIVLNQGSYDANSNDSGANWSNSRNCAGGAYGCRETDEDPVPGPWDKTDFGSPGFLSGITDPTGNVPPTPLWRRVGIPMNTPTLVTLTYCDDGNPSGGPVTYTIPKPALDEPPTLPTHGTLTDPGNSHVIIEGDLPYTLVNNGSQVLYTPTTDYTSAFGGGDGATDTADRFSFAVNDGAKASRSDGQIALVVQKGGLIVTELMYDPAQLNPDPNTGDSNWEWIEVTNITENAITLRHITNTIGEPDGLFDVNASIPAHAVRIIAPGDNASRTAAEFLAAWSLDSSQVIFVSGWETLLNDGSRIQLLDDGDALLDEVYYNTSTTGPWPTTNNESSIYVKYGKLTTAVDNDQGENWLLSAVGVDNAYASTATPPDVGSPGALPVAGCTAPTITSITPETGVQGTGNRTQNTGPGPLYFVAPAPVHVVIVGTNFVDGGTTAKLVAQSPPVGGETELTLTLTTVTETQIDATADLTGSFPGSLDGVWNLVVTTCDSATKTGAFTVSMCFPEPQDADGDGDVDLADFVTFQSCFNGPNRPYKPTGDQRLCGCVDVNEPLGNPAVDDVDLSDFTAFQSCFNGPNRAPKQPACDLANQP